jgi:hypothetical protein
VSPDALAQPRTDVVTLANGDRITGEVVRLDRGRLEFKTDDAGTLYLEWDKLVSLVTKRLVEVTTTDGRLYLGSIAQSTDRTMAVVSGDSSESLPMADVTVISTIGRSFWRKLDGSIDAGFNYTRSSGVAQLNLNWDTLYRQPRRYLRPRWFVIGGARFERNESLGLELRSQVATAIGPRLVNTNRAQLTVGAGLAFNDEQGVDVEPTQNLEALFVFRHSYFTYDQPRTNTDLSVQYYPSLSSIGRQRLQLDASGKREFLKDLFLALSLFYSVDSEPPNPDADKYDVGVVASIGWTY